MIAINWAAQEGWQPGCRDIDAFMAVDPEGFLGGFLDGCMRASISMITYDERFAFIGFYIVDKEFRGRGLGYALWQAAMARAGARTIGLDGVVAQQENYSRSGFVFAYNNIRYGGVVGNLGVLDDSTTDEDIVLIAKDSVESVEAIVRYDRDLFPADRDVFTRLWLSTLGHVAYAAMSGGCVVGYGVIRPCHNGNYKVGPLFAQSVGIARALLKGLLPVANEAEVFLDVPEPNAHARAMAADLGLVPVFETARMYTNVAPQLDLQRIFGVSTFELG